MCFVICIDRSHHCSTILTDTITTVLFLLMLWLRLQTSNPDVYAVGDVASFPLLLADGGPTVRQEHVTNARNSAVQAAKALLGR